MSLLKNVHDNLPEPTQNGNSYLVKGTYKYYHYGCDNFKDMGWGCGYRTLQTMCSWISNIPPNKNFVPTIPEIQQTLVDLQDKQNSFFGSREWIGSVEICLVIDQLYGTPCKILHANCGKDLPSFTNQLVEHFTKNGSPIMMGGDKDCSSKGIMGIHIEGTNLFLLIVDPHFVGTAKSNAQLQENSWVKWQKISDFSECSFYNFCLPQLSYR